MLYSQLRSLAFAQTFAHNAKTKCGGLNAFMNDGRPDIDVRVAVALGFPKLKYFAVERERRWLCREVPRDRVIRT
jgi:hypothetical protein